MDGCDYCGRPKPGMAHTDAPWKAFCSDECFRAWRDAQGTQSIIHPVQAEMLNGVLTMHSDPPMAFNFTQRRDFEDAKPPKQKPTNQMSLF